MDYTALKTNVQDLCENTFTDDQLALFTDQAEKRIYNTIQPPALRKTQDGNLTTGNEYLTLPTDFLHPHSIALVDGSNNYHFLAQVDNNFIREAYPNRTSTGQPKYYGMYDKDTFIVGPTPDSGYSVRLTYGYYPESIVTAGNTWLGDNFDNVLLNAVMVEAARMLKEEEDMVKMYDKMYLESLSLAKLLSDGKLRQDSYRSGQPRVPVT